MEQQSDLFSTEIKIDTTAKEHIRAIASWCMVIVVVAVSGYLLSVLELIMQPDEPVVTQSEGFSASFLAGQKSVAGTIITIMIGLAINYFLYRFASTVGNSITSLSQERFSNSVRNLKIYFAITTIIMILFLLLLLIAVLALL
ncbi:MAG: hypothetical protein ACXWV8_07905 [Chitinophagaceae bacterium]